MGRTDSSQSRWPCGGSPWTARDRWDHSRPRDPCVEGPVRSARGEGGARRGGVYAHSSKARAGESDPVEFNSRRHDEVMWLGVRGEACRIEPTPALHLPPPERSVIATDRVQDARRPTKLRGEFRVGFPSQVVGVVARQRAPSHPSAQDPSVRSDARIHWSQIGRAHV